MNSYFLFFWIILIIFVVSCSLKNTKEGFTPKIRSMYRPYMRNIRLGIESYTTPYNTDFFIGFFRKFGLY